MADGFDGDRAIRAYLAQLADKRLVARDARDEMEGHLRDEIDDLMANGLSAREAFERSVATFGRSSAVLAEYDKLFHGRRLAQLANWLSYYFNGRIVMRLVLGILVGALFMLGGLMLEGGHVGSLMSATGVLIVGGGALAGLIIAYPLKTVLVSFMLALTGREAVRSAYLDAIRVFRSYGQMAFLAGFVGTLFGMIHVMEHLDKPDLIGPGVAVAICCVLYGLLIKLFVGRALVDAFTARAFPALDKAERPDRDELMTA
jgi:hypothetical protein